MNYLALWLIAGLSLVGWLCAFYTSSRFYLAAQLARQELDAANERLRQAQAEVMTDHARAIAALEVRDTWKRIAADWKERAERGLEENAKLVERIATRVMGPADVDVDDPPSVREADRRIGEERAAARATFRAIPTIDRHAPPVAMATASQDADLDEFDDDDDEGVE